MFHMKGSITFEVDGVISHKSIDRNYILFKELI